MAFTFNTNPTLFRNLRHSEPWAVLTADIDGFIRRDTEKLARFETVSEARKCLIEAGYVETHGYFHACPSDTPWEAAS